MGSNAGKLVLNSDRLGLRSERGFVKCGAKFNVDVEASLRVSTYAPHNNSRLLCTAGAKVTAWSGVSSSF